MPSFSCSRSRHPAPCGRRCSTFMKHRIFSGAGHQLELWVVVDQVRARIYGWSTCCSITLMKTRIPWAFMAIRALRARNSGVRSTPRSENRITPCSVFEHHARVSNGGSSASDRIPRSGAPGNLSLRWPYRLHQTLLLIQLEHPPSRAWFWGVDAQTDGGLPADSN